MSLFPPPSLYRTTQNAICEASAHAFWEATRYSPFPSSPFKLSVMLACSPCSRPLWRAFRGVAHRKPEQGTVLPRPACGTATRFAASDASAGSSTALTAATHFSAKMLAAPHRDLTHVAYGEWFALYVQARKQWRALGASQASAALAAKQHIDAQLLSSLFARHWTEVPATASAISTYRWWWHTTSSPRPVTSSATLELCTPAFLTEPLLGGSQLRLCMEDVRAAAIAESATPPQDRRSVDDVSAAASEDVPSLILPFSSLWEVKQSAYWRPAAPTPAPDATAASPASSTPATAALSLQERQARQALLQSIDQLLQLQRDAEVSAHERGSSGGGGLANRLQRVCVLTPTEEWELLCALPRYRQSVAPSQPRWLSLGCLCEDTTARLAYCVHALSWQQQQQRSVKTAPPGNTAPRAVRALAIADDHPRLRGFSLPSVHERSCALEALQRRHTARRQLSTATSAPAAASVHDQARQGCSAAVRRMSNREENIRQSFSVR